jgi:predicted dienelactone hydrolase
MASYNWIAVFTAAAFVGCGTSEHAPPPLDAPEVTPGADYGGPGPYPVGNRRIAIVDRTGERSLTVELWYPAVESARAAADAGQPIEAFEAGTEDQATLAQLVAEAPAECVRRQMRSAAAAAPIADPVLLPVVVFSHCHACTRYDVAEVSERLASHGIVVAAPDHIDNTLWDQLAGSTVIPGPSFLEVRTSDVSSVLDRLLDPAAPEMPAELRGRIDGARAGVMGHSFGGATTGRVVVTDDRFAAAMTIAAPINPFLVVDLDAVKVPYLFVLAKEDNSITELGNLLLRRNYERVATAAWLVELADAGHWSMSDLCGLVDMFDAGCGEGIRQTEAGVPFTYVDPAIARERTADAAAAFFAKFLLGDADGVRFLDGMDEPGLVTVERHDAR